MNLKTKLAASILLASSVSMAQATTYSVASVFGDGGMQSQTTFDGTFDWDGSSVTNFNGLLSQAMWGWNSARSGGVFDSNGTAALGMQSLGTGMMGTTAGVDYANKVYAKPGGYADDEAPLLELTHQLASVTAGGVVTTSVFLNANDTNVYTNDGTVAGGGNYDIGNDEPFGDLVGNMGNTNQNFNAYFTLVFDEMNPMDTSVTFGEMVYGDCTALGLMSNMLVGDLCMTAHQFGGSMGGSPASLAISEVSAVPVPAAAWLFGGALMSLFGANRRKNVLPA